jgi:hypothetical protein
MRAFIERSALSSNSSSTSRPKYAVKLVSLLEARSASASNVAAKSGGKIAPLSADVTLQLQSERPL